MKKAVIINASPRGSGTTARVLEGLTRRLEAEYATERIDLGSSPIAPCRGCNACRPDGACVLTRDAATEAGELIAGADLIVFATPCYWGNIPSTLKAVLDRNVTTFEHFRDGAPKPKLSGKKAAFLVTAGSAFPRSRRAYQAAGTLRALRAPCASGGIAILSETVFDAAWRLESGDAKLAAKTEREFARKIARVRIA